MSLLLILLAGGLWAATLFCLAYYLTFSIPNKGIRAAIGVVAMIGLFTLPMRDEIKGAEEFEVLCKTGGVYQISPNAVGKKFDLRYSSTEKKKLEELTRPVEEITISYTDVATGEVVATSKAYIAKGGWLVQHRLLMNSGGGDGAFIGRPQCFPPSDVEQERRLQAVTNKIIN